MVALAAQEQKREAFWWRRYVRTGTEAVEHGAMLTARILFLLHRLTTRRNAARGFEEQILVLHEKQRLYRDATADYEMRAREMLLTITRCRSRCTACLLACLIDFLLAALELHYYTLRRCGAPASASGCILRVKLQHSS